MDCVEFDRLLGLEFDLPLGLWWAFHGHAIDCADCASNRESYRIVIALFRSSPVAT